MTTTKQTNEPMSYVKNSLKGTVHLATHQRINTENQPSTLCGQRIRWTLWEEGDETLSGMAATCKRCLTIAKGTHS